MRPISFWQSQWNDSVPIRAHAGPSMHEGDGRPPVLAPLRVLDLSRLLPGPMACRHLADLGAQVLKVEPPLPGRPGLPGDDAAYMGPGEDGVSHFYRVVNHGKRRLVLDLKQPEQLDHLRALVREAHAVVEGFRPGVMERLGLGYEALRAINPAIVLTSISGYGQQGPLRLAAGHDLNYLALAGVVDQTRTPDDGRPVFSHLQIADQLGGAQTAAIGTLAAVLGAQWTGQGRWVDVSMTDAVRQHQVILGTDALADGRSPQAGASLLNGGVPCYNLYRCADGGWLAVGALELKFWQGVCAVLGRDDWAARHWSLGEEAPGSEAARALIDELAALIVRQPLAVWVERFAGTDCCVTPVLGAHEALFGRAPVTLAEGMQRLTAPALTLR